MARTTLATPRATPTRRTTRMVTIAWIVVAAAMLLLTAAYAGVNLRGGGGAAQDAPSVVHESTDPIYFPGRPF